MHILRAHIVILKVIPGRKKLEFFGIDFDAPVAKFATNAAVAFAGALREVDGRFVFNSPADTAAVVGFGHDGTCWKAMTEMNRVK